MTGFKCHKCGFKSPKKGMCAKCNIAFEPSCPVCSSGKDYCTCAGMIPATKAQKPR